MSDKLVTIASFDTPTQAGFVRSRLEADGIRVYTDNEAIVGMVWHYSNAFGGIKLQVHEEDHERALSIVEEMQNPELNLDKEWLEDGFTEGAMEEEDYGDVESEDEETTTPADRILRRALRSALLGVLFFPLQLYALWLVGRILVEGHSLNGKNKRQMALTLLLCVYIFLIAFVILGFL